MNSDMKEKIENLSTAFAEVEKTHLVPSELVACVHLGCAASILKQMRIAGLLTPDKIVDYFAQTLDIAMSAMDPRFPTPTISFIEADGSVSSQKGKKH